jgi:hypothetical protein
VQEKIMSETPLQRACQQVSDQRVLIIKQETLIAGMRREGGTKLERANEDLKRMRDELERMQAALDEMVFNS